VLILGTISGSLKGRSRSELIGLPHAFWDQALALPGNWLPCLRKPARLLRRQAAGRPAAPAVLAKFTYGTLGKRRGIKVTAPILRLLQPVSGSEAWLRARGRTWGINYFDTARCLTRAANNERAWWERRSKKYRDKVLYQQQDAGKRTGRSALAGPGNPA